MISRQTCCLISVFVSLAGLMFSARADDNATLDNTQIIGNRELPKVLYIVPWKTSNAGARVEHPVRSLLNAEVQPVDRDSFRRFVAYQSSVSSQVPPKVAPGTPTQP
jgi:hypothetical protein